MNPSKVSLCRPPAAQLPSSFFRGIVLSVSPFRVVAAAAVSVSLLSRLVSQAPSLHLQVAAFAFQGVSEAATTLNDSGTSSKVAIKNG